MPRFFGLHIESRDIGIFRTPAPTIEGATSTAAKSIASWLSTDLVVAECWTCQHVDFCLCGLYGFRGL